MNILKSAWRGKQSRQALGCKKCGAADPPKDKDIPEPRLRLT